jgi:hypothetical protein
MTKQLFKPGQSGNPNGRPPGTSGAAKLRAAIADDLEAIIEAMVERAKAGDTGAAKLLLDRAIPALKPQAASVAIDGMMGGTLSQRATAAIDAAAAGELSPDVAAQLVAAVGTLAKVIEIDELEKRLAKLEKLQEVNHGHTK